VKDAVLLSITNGRAIIQTWHNGPGAPLRGFSALRERGTGKIEELLSPLAAPKVVVEGPDPGPIKLPVIEKTFLERRPVQLGIALGVAVTIVGIVLFATRDPGTFVFDGDVTNDRPGLGR
ncbi:MAG: hypothetical protein H0T42_28770, partial [Deltaproteobacteria bacterium]|nr:hypothetical protein [Deltaproteobacteria bacterium]